MKMKRKLLINPVLDVKTYFFSKSMKNIEKKVIYAVLEKKKYRKIRIKTYKLVVCAILEKRNIVAKKKVFFGFLPPTNENVKKTT